jgi:hypothetical protein
MESARQFGARLPRVRIVAQHEAAHHRLTHDRAAAMIGESPYRGLP